MGYQKKREEERSEVIMTQNFPKLMTDIKTGPGGASLVGAVVENPPANAGDTDSSPGPGRSHMPRSN